VVLAAQRIDHPTHDLVRPWFDDLAAGDAPFSVPALVRASFLHLGPHTLLRR
jgi:predicted nucleic acid-binding protein